ncbi:DUF4252 domain-containing protein [Phocaeicola sp.]
MKKIIFTLLLLVVCHIGYGQSISALFNEFGNEPNADCVTISPFLMSIGKMFSANHEGSEIVGNIKSMKVIDLEDCPAEVQERFIKKVNKLDLDGYETLMRMNDEGDKVRVMMKMKKEVIRELLLVCTGNGDCTLVQINGKFTKDDIDKLINRETGKKNGRR